MGPREAAVFRQFGRRQARNSQAVYAASLLFGCNCEFDRELTAAR